MRHQFDVILSAGSFQPPGGGSMHFAHRWSSGGVAVEAEFTGAHLLHLAAGGCVLNDVYREAAALDMHLDGVQVLVTGTFDPETWRSLGIAYSVQVRSAHSDHDVEKLLAIVDEVAEIPRALRLGAPVRRAGLDEPW